MAISSFEQLDVWKMSHRLTPDVFSYTRSLPDDEKYGLISQMRRSAVSVLANIAEGFKRKGNKDKVRFYNIAQGSLEELKYYFILCSDLNYININDEQLIIFETIGKMLNNLQKKILKT